jgi:hypothetical protein
MIKGSKLVGNFNKNKSTDLEKMANEFWLALETAKELKKVLKKILGREFE